MKLPQFTTSAACKSGLACANCRSDQCESWYERWAKQFEMPEGFAARDGDTPEQTAGRRREACRLKLEMGWTPQPPPPKPKPLKVNRLTRRVAEGPGTMLAPGQPPTPGERVGQAERRAAAEAKVREDLAARWRIEGPRAWASLHTWAATVDLSTPEALAAARKWLDDFDGRIGCGSCGSHWARMNRDHPPDLSSNEALTLWAIIMHNLVNRRLKKPWWLRVLP